MKNQIKSYCRKCGKHLKGTGIFNEYTGREKTLCPTQFPIKEGAYLDGHTFYEGE